MTVDFSGRLTIDSNDRFNDGFASHPYLTDPAFQAPLDFLGANLGAGLFDQGNRVRFTVSVFRDSTLRLHDTGIVLDGLSCISYGFISNFPAFPDGDVEAFSAAYSVNVIDPSAVPEPGTPALRRPGLA